MALSGSSSVPTRGLRHLALRVRNLSTSRAFYETLFGMRVVWEPDAENVYLSSGTDNLALHQIPMGDLVSYRQDIPQRLDHLGFVMESEALVDRLFQQVERQGEAVHARIVKPPRRHRDGSYSFYLSDPDGNIVQVLYDPDVSRLG